jgi:hypothetical protein
VADFGQQGAWQWSKVKPGIVYRKVHLRFLISANHDNSLHHAAVRMRATLVSSKLVPVNMNGMNIVTGIGHLDAIALSPLQMVDRGSLFREKTAS